MRAQWRKKVRSSCGLVLFLGLGLIMAPLVAHADDIAQIVSDYDRFNAALDPVAAASRGDPDAAERWPDDTQQAEAARLRQRMAFRERLTRLDLKALKGEAQLNAQLMMWENDLAIDGQKFDTSRIPFTSDEGFFQEVGYAADNTPLRSEADARHWLVRMSRIPVYDAQQIDNMRRGIKTHFVQPRLIAEIALRAVKAQAALPERDNAALRPFDTLPDSMPLALRQSLRAEGERIVHEKIKPAELALARFFRLNICQPVAILWARLPCLKGRLITLISYGVRRPPHLRQTRYLPSGSPRLPGFTGKCSARWMRSAFMATSGLSLR